MPTFMRDASAFFPRATTSVLMYVSVHANNATSCCGWDLPGCLPALWGGGWGGTDQGLEEGGEGWGGGAVEEELVRPWGW